MPRRSVRLSRLPHYTTLLVALLLDIVLVPLLLAVGAGLPVARTVMALVLAAAFVASGSSAVAGVGLVIAVAAMVLSEVLHSPTVIAIEIVLRILFVGYVTYRLTRDIMRQGDAVTLDTIAGAACIYMLLGVLWANGYVLLEHLKPGSFFIPDEWKLPDSNIAPALIYFSYATLTTVGYGDVRAAGPAAGGMAVVEAIVGQLFLTITIARLVGKHLSRSS